MHHHLQRKNRFDPRSRSLPAGFTLPEILIVIVIIVVLVGIMFPFIRGVREKARSAKCIQNLRQIGVGLNAYIAENGGRFPDGKVDVSWNPNITTSRCWYDAAAENMGLVNISRYYNDPKADPLPDVFGCPSGHGKPYHPFWPYTGDYAANTRLGRPGDNVTMIAAVKNPSATPYVQDTVRQNQWGEWNLRTGSSKTSDQAFADRHGGKGNILWVDGHVSSMGYSEYMDYANDPSRGGIYNFVRGNW